MTNGPVEPRADLRACAAEMFGMFTALQQEGFTVAQALTIIGQMLASGGKGNS